MLTKRAFIYIILTFIVVLSFLVFIYFKNRLIVSSEPLKSVPLDAAFIIRINDFRNLVKNTKKNNKIWEELIKLPVFSRMDQQIEFIDNLNSRYPIARDLLFNKPSYISAHYTGRDRVSFIHIYKLPKGLTGKKINELISKLLVNSGTITQRKYQGRDIYDIRLLNVSPVKSFSYTITEGLFILSFSSILIEDAIRQLDLTKPVIQQPGFKKVLSTAGKNVDANLFINFKNLPKAVSTCINQKYKSKVKSYDYFASWAELDINIKEDMVLLNGFTHFSDTLNYTANLFIDQVPQKINIDNILPSFISSFLVISLSDIGTYFENYKDYLYKLGKLNKYLKEINLLKNKYNINIIDDLVSIFDNEIAVAMDNGKIKNGNPDTYIILGTKSKSQSEKKLSEILKKLSQKSPVSVGKLTYNCRIDNELSHPVYKLPVKNITGKIFGELFNMNEETYFTFIDNYIVFGSSVKSLSGFIHNNVLKRTIVTNDAYSEFKYNISPRSSVSFYANLGRSSTNYSKYLTSEIFNGWEENIQVFHKIQVIGIQINTSDDLLYNNVFLKYVPDFSYAPRTVWESRLDTVIDFKPAFVKNHYTNQSEIFVQDLKNNIYLINNAGRILWKINISEKINSEINQIDYYKNGKLQIIFSTKNYIHLLDRNGNYVERYPVKLRSPATNGMSLFDYENNKNYRIFIAGEDKKIYAYAKDGTLISGWKFDKTESEVNQPVNHFRLGNKDYLVFGDKFRTYILDRRGNTRINVKEIFPVSFNNNYFLDDRNNLSDSRIVITDTAGVVHFIYFNGKIEKEDLGQFTSGHFFDFKDMDGDGNRDFIYLDNKSLKVFRHNKKRLFDYSFSEKITDRPVYYYFSYSDRKLGVVSESEKVIYLINNDGSLYKGFPLKGSTLFSIGNFTSTSSQFNLVVGSDENFLLNYVVQ
jgi:hypothetical protein